MQELVEVEPKVKKDIVMFEEMTKLFIRWVYTNSVFLLIMLWLDRYSVTQGSWLYCSANQTFLLYTESIGAHYITILCLQLLLVANTIKVVLYEGGMRSKAFGEATPESTYCMTICYCNGWVPEDENDPENLPKREAAASRVDDGEMRNDDITADMDNSTTQLQNNTFKKYKQF